jgi:predicted N-acetyltransferase YhbS
MKEPTIRLAAADELAAVARLYQATGYSGHANGDDRTLVALVEGAIVGVVRLCCEHGIMVLRGMRVADSHQGRGIGAALLRELEPLLANQDCYCIPFSHLEQFYSSIGFEVLEDGLVPAFLAERAARYRSKGEAISPMVRRISCN